MGDTKPLKPLDSVKVNFKQVNDDLSADDMKKLNVVLSNCRDAIEMAHSNGKEAFKYQLEVERFLTKNTVFQSDNKSVDYAKSNPRVNFTEIKVDEGKMFYVGNRYNWRDFASQYVGKWTQNKNWGEKSDYIFEGKHIHDGDDLKDTGVETLKDDLFYGKFAQGSRTSGVYTWKQKSFYMGNFKDGKVHGFGCLKQVSTSSEDEYEFIFGEFSNNDLPKSYILKRGESINWVSGEIATELSKNHASQVSYYLNKVTEDFKQLGIWTEGLHKLEDKTGLNRTGLYAIAALGLAGVGFWAYKKYKKYSTQKKKDKADIEAARAAAESVSASGSGSASESVSASASASASASESVSSSGIGSLALVPAARTRKTKSASKSAKRSEAGKKGAQTKAANKAAKLASARSSGSGVVLRSAILSKDDVNVSLDPVVSGVRRSQRLRANK